jgi:hypothetical protein
MDASVAPPIRSGDCDAALLAGDSDFAIQLPEIICLSRFKKF